MVTYDLETKKLIQRIKEKNHKKVLIQLPDGLKPDAQRIVDEVTKATDAEVLIWLSTCFGACDIPFGLKQLGIDIVVQYGHNFFRKNPEGW